MIFIKPKKEKKRNLHQVFLATSSEIQICRIHITGKKKKEKKKKKSQFVFLHLGFVSLLKEQKLNLEEVSFVLFSTPLSEGNEKVICLSGGGTAANYTHSSSCASHRQEGGRRGRGWRREEGLNYHRAGLDAGQGLMHGSELV